jgi:hypothetical protein
MVASETNGTVKQPGKSSKFFGVLEAVMVYSES